MGHYDDYYEELQSKYLKERKEKQSKCKHVEWKILSVNKHGKVTHTICKTCELVNTCQ